jgi:UDP-N-acetylmuramoylalanine--D-glutamate ligase
MSGRFAGRRAVVIGAGVSGAASARALAEEGASVVVSDERPLDSIDVASELGALGVVVEGGGHRETQLDATDVVVVSPGVAPSAPVIGWALGRSLPVWGELELGARLCDVPYLAVTGTNGKTTTTALLADMIRADGRDAVACGNIGHPFPAAAREDHDVLVVEASSFQLRFQSTFHPRVSVLLNVSPDHLDWHGGPKDYAEAKASIFAAQEGDDVHVGNADDAAAREISSRAPCRQVWFRMLDEPSAGEVGYVDGALVSRIDGERSLGAPDAERAGFREDAAAAAAAALSFGVDTGAASLALRTFTPAAHRGELVATVGGVRFIDNSKATNVHAALAAIAAIAGRPVLIAGGRAKGVDLSPLADASPALTGVVAIGEAAPAIVALFDGRVPVRVAASIEEAVAVATAMAPPEGTVLLAPACASWDMFADYRERGERFAAAALAEERQRVDG